MTLAEFDLCKRELGCIVGRLGWGAECGGPIELHHPREGAGAAQKTGAWLKIPTSPITLGSSAYTASARSEPEPGMTSTRF
jgi:hypothetical protein